MNDNHRRLSNAGPFGGLFLSLLALLLLAPVQAWAEAGRVLFARGEVTIIDARGAERAPARGDLLEEGDTVLTGARSSLHARMVDGGFLAVRASTRMRIDTFQYEGREDGTEKSFFSLLKGGFRTITGAIGRTHKENVRITTPVATIGIRGTDHEPFFVPPTGLGGGQQPGAYDKVNSGAAVIQSEVGELVIGAGQVGFVPAADAQPTLLPQLPSFYQQPAGDGDQQEEGQQEEGQPRDGQQQEGDQGGDDGAPAEGDDDQPTPPTAPAESGGDDGIAPAGGDEVVTVMTAVGDDDEVVDFTNRTVTDSQGQTSELDDDGHPVPTPTPTPTPSPTPDPTPSPTPDPTPSPTPDPTPSPTPDPTPSPTPDPTPSPTPDPTPSPTPDPTPDPTPTPSPTPTPAPEPTETAVLYNAGKMGLVGFPTSQTRGYVADDSEVVTDGPFNAFVSWSNSEHPQGTVGLAIVNSTDPQMANIAGSSVGIVVGYRGAESVEENYIDQSGSLATQNYTVGDGLVHWIYGPTPYPHYLGQILTGTVQYQWETRSHPSDQGGVTGSLNDAWLTANFTNQSVSAGVDVTVSGSNWVANLTDYPITAVGFDAITCPICTPPDELTVTRDGGDAGGSMFGLFTGDGLNGAMLSYNLFQVDGTSGGVDTVDGMVGFAATTTNDLATPYRQLAVAAPDLDVANNRGFPGAITQYNNAGRVGSDADGNITALDVTPLGFLQRNHGVAPLNLAMGSSSVVDAGQDPITGVVWGRWSGAAYTATNRIDGSSQLVTNVAGMHYVMGPELTEPMRLPISGSYSYNLMGGTLPTNQDGVTGVLNGATLDANFTTMTVTTGVDVTVAGATLNAIANNVPIQDFGHFYVSEGSVNPLTISCSGVGCGSAHSGVIAGGFAGPTGGGAGFAYSLEALDLIDPMKVSGVAAFRR